MIIIELIGGIIAIIGIVISVLIIAHILPIVLFFLQVAVYKVINNVYHLLLSLKNCKFMCGFVKLRYFSTPHICIYFDKDTYIAKWEFNVDFEGFFMMFNIRLIKWKEASK